MGSAYQKLTKTTVTRRRTNSNGKRKTIIRRKAGNLQLCKSCIVGSSPTLASKAQEAENKTVSFFICKISRQSYKNKNLRRFRLNMKQINDIIII